MIIATAGHVDHGKTSLVKALTGVDADRLPEEKRRGMTIDLGFAYLADDQAVKPAEAAAARPGVAAREGANVMGFVDVPGHERFVHNMLAGVAGIDCALLVIAADDGPMPQTREHVAILDLLGVRVGAVALTKIDAVEPARVAAVAEEIAALLAPTSLAASPIFPLSSLSGAGLPPLRAHLQGLRSAHALERVAARGRFRMTVDRSFTVAGAGIVVTGTIIAGEVATGDEVQILLAGKTARVRGLHAQNRAARHARAGERCALNLAASGLSHADIARGDWIVQPHAAPAAQRIDARIRVLASEARALRHWTPVHVHIGAADVTGRIALLEADAIAPGASDSAASHGSSASSHSGSATTHGALAQLVLDSPVGACHGDIIILRDQSAQRTIGGGKVIDIFAPPRGRARPARVALLRAMEHDNTNYALTEALQAAPAGLDLTRFAACRNLSATEMAAAEAASGMQRVSSDTGFLPAHWASARAAALNLVQAWHVRSPDSPGVPEDRLLEGARLPLSTSARSALANDLVVSTQLVRSGAALRLPSHSNGLQGADQALWERIRTALSAAAARPPTVAELAVAIDEPPRRVKELLVRVAKQPQAWRISEERFALSATVRAWAAHAVALAGPARERRFSAADFRDRSGIGRNLSIEILEFFDRVKFTRRIGDARLLQCAPHEVFGAISE